MIERTQAPRRHSACALRFKNTGRHPGEGGTQTSDCVASILSPLKAVKQARYPPLFSLFQGKIRPIERPHAKGNHASILRLAQDRYAQDCEYIA
jgi:hypothetical protein